MSTEHELVRKAQRNDTGAFERLISPYTIHLLNHAYRLLKNQQDAEDALQEAYLKAYRSLKSFEGNSSFKTWLYRITTNVCYDMLRSKKNTTVVSLNTTDEDGEREIDVPDETYSPEVSVQKKAAFEVLKEAIDTLGEDQKVAVTLRDIDGLSYDEIAEITSSNVGTVKSRINRARMHLKKLLEKNKELFT